MLLDPEQPVTLVCRDYGTPQPSVQWALDGRPMDAQVRTHKMPKLSFFKHSTGRMIGGNKCPMVLADC